jgi:hypothetical protein
MVEKSFLFDEKCDYYNCYCITSDFDDLMDLFFVNFSCGDFYGSCTYF